jgi:hypothetical protein
MLYIYFLVYFQNETIFFITTLQTEYKRRHWIANHGGEEFWDSKMMKRPGK